MHPQQLVVRLQTKNIDQCVFVFESISIEFMLVIVKKYRPIAQFYRNGIILHSIIKEYILPLL